MIFDFFDSVGGEQRLLAPEVVQTSAMDCGPAALKCILEGFGISASYGRLREACQTDVDGTSINMIEDVAVQLGLEAVQTILPPDHFILPESQNLPALVVVRLPNGLAHFVVAWRRHGSFIQIMDPATGRRLVSEKQFLRQLYIHQYALPADAWRAWAGSDGFCTPLRKRMLNLSLDEAEAEGLIETALLDPSWRSLAALDSAIRLVSAIKRAKALLPSEIGPVLEHFFKQALQAPDDASATPVIPSSYWSVQAPPDNPAAPYLLLRGAVLIRVFGRREAPSPDDEDDDQEAETEPPAPLSPELVAALEETPMQPLRRLLALLREDGLLIPAILSVALFVTSLDLMIETALFRGLLEIGTTLHIKERIGAAFVLFIFLIGLLFIESPLAATVLRLGRRLESRLRIEFLSKIPRLGDRYFHSRLISDMAQRAYELRQIRTLPSLSVQWVRLIVELLLTSIAVIWINPTSAFIAAFATIFTIAFSLVTQPFLVEQDLVMRTHVGALSRFYLDALLGLLPIRTHGAERAVRRQQESLLVTWAEASKRFYRVNIMINTISALISAGFTIWIVFDYMSKADNLSGIILLFYWTLRLPVLGRSLAQAAQQLPMQRNRVLRLLEPLGAPEEEGTMGHLGEEGMRREGAVAIEMQNLTVQAGGHKILENISLSIKAGTDVAIVGPSGAGKSSLVGLLLGWHRAATGQILIDGEPLTGKRLLELRNQIAWVDPTVQLWNRSMLDNLEYGAAFDTPERLNTIIRQADLISVLEKVPLGLQTQLGESGGLLSGGEGQRVRLGRAMYRQNVGLVILDEAFRGLDRDKRRHLLAQARKFWHDATILFISHDVEQTQDFERVLVIEKGQIVEDDAPSALIAQPNSRYHALLVAEEAVRRGLWESTEWTHLWLSNGRLNEKKEEGA